MATKRWARSVAAVAVVALVAVPGVGAPPGSAAITVPVCPSAIPDTPPLANCVHPPATRAPIPLAPFEVVPAATPGVSYLRYKIPYDTLTGLPWCANNPTAVAPCVNDPSGPLRRYYPEPPPDPDVPAYAPRAGALVRFVGQVPGGAESTLEGSVDSRGCGVAAACEITFYSNTNEIGAERAVIADLTWTEFQPGPTPGTVVGTVHREDQVFLLSPAGVPVEPTASFTAAPSAPGSKTWQFDGSGSTAPAGRTIVGYEWDFGDGEASNQVAPTHRYRRGGSYQVTLTVTDSAGAKHSTTQTVEVDNRLIVNSVADVPNAPDAGEACDTGNDVGDEPECTLRAAIEASNAADEALLISFAIDVTGTPQITLSSSLPAVTAPVTIDGTTQEGAWVELYSPATTYDALTLAAAATVKGLVFHGFRIAVTVSASGATVTGNRIGVSPGGSASVGPPVRAVVVTGGSNVDVADNQMTAQQIAFGSTSTATGGTFRSNRVGVNGAGSARLADLPAAGAFLITSGPWELTDNVIVVSATGVTVRGATAAGTRISGNRIGVSLDGKTRLGPANRGVIADGVPDVVIEGNAIASNPEEGVDITVTGVVQTVGTALQPPGNELPGEVMGTRASIKENQVGVPGSLENGLYGILVYAQASEPDIVGNRSAGHVLDADGPDPAGAEIAVIGTTDALVADNLLGTNPVGTAVVGGVDGIRLEGTSRTLVTGNVVGGLGEIGVVIAAYVPAPGQPKVVARADAVEGNRIGVARNGVTALPNRTGIGIQGATLTTVQDNTVSGNDEGGVVLGGGASEVLVRRNRVGVSGTESTKVGNEYGVVVGDGARDVVITENVIAANRRTGVEVANSAEGTTFLDGNWIGRNRAGTAMPNGTGVYAAAPTLLTENTIWFNTDAGIEVEPGTLAMSTYDSTWANGGKGIAGPVEPAPPKLDVVRVGTGADERTWFVVDTPGTAITSGVIGLFANPDCSDPDEGRIPVKVTRIPDLNGDTASVVVPTAKLPPDAQAFTATVTVAQAPTGRTSSYSNCAAPATYPDSSGTGIPDVVQQAVGGNPADPSTAAFPGDGGTIVKLDATAGRLREVGPRTAPDGAADLDFPAGLYSFEVHDLEPGQDVTVDVFTGTAAAATYWRYGRIPTGGTGWYPWPYDDNAKLGAIPLTPDEAGRSVRWALRMRDGAAGDDDGTANGVVVDPGGPADGSGPPPAATPTSTTTSVPGATTTTPGGTPSGGLPRTGGGTAPLPLGAALVAVGIVLVSVARLRRSDDGPSRR